MKAECRHQADPSTKNGYRYLRFCLMGYVAALFLRARHLMTIGDEGRQQANAVGPLVDPRPVKRGTSAFGPTETGRYVL